MCSVWEANGKPGGGRSELLANELEIAASFSSFSWRELNACSTFLAAPCPSKWWWLCTRPAAAAATQELELKNKVNKTEWRSKSEYCGSQNLQHTIPAVTSGKTGLEAASDVKSYCIPDDLSCIVGWLKGQNFQFISPLSFCVQKWQPRGQDHW